MPSGLGLNSGVADAHNLAWKLAAYIDGADECLLDSYELNIGTNPEEADTDGDGWTDSEEIYDFTDPEDEDVDDEMKERHHHTHPEGWFPQSSMFPHLVACWTVLQRANCRQTRNVVRVLSNCLNKCLISQMQGTL